jgi:hypothetical protein
MDSSLNPILPNDKSLSGAKGFCRSIGSFAMREDCAQSILNYFLVNYFARRLRTMGTPIDDIILEGDSKMVYLSTRITQKERKMLDEIQGWLQTERSCSTVSFQETVMRTIRFAYDSLQAQIAHIDNEQNDKVIQMPERHPNPPVTPQNAHKDENWIQQMREISNKETNWGYGR